MISKGSGPPGSAEPAAQTQPELAGDGQQDANLQDIPIVAPSLQATPCGPLAIIIAKGRGDHSANEVRNEWAGSPLPGCRAARMHSALGSGIDGLYSCSGKRETEICFA